MTAVLQERDELLEMRNAKGRDEAMGSAMDGREAFNQQSVRVEHTGTICNCLLIFSFPMQPSVVCVDLPSVDECTRVGLRR
jgi:hypothetical protein